MVRSTTTARCTAFLVCFLFLVSFQFTSDAMGVGSEAGTYGASFLQIPVGPRQLGSSEIVSGMYPDASIVFSNPAALSGISDEQMFLTTANWLDGMQMSAAGVVFPIPRSSMRLAFSTRFLYSGGLRGYNEALQVVSEESYYDFGFSTALSQCFEDIGLSLGLGVTYIREHLYPDDGNGYTFSFGAAYQFDRNNFQFFAKDIGGRISFDGYRYPIDSRFVFGYGRSLNLRQGKLNVGAQMCFTRGDYKQLQVGGEFEFNRFFVLRTALNRYLESPTTSEYPLSAGMGFRFWNIAIDYAYAPHWYFPATHMFSFTYDFGQLGAPQKTGPGELMDKARLISAPSSRASERVSRGAEKRGVEVAKRIEADQLQEKVNPQAEDAGELASGKDAQKKAAEQTVKPDSYILIAGLHGRLDSALAEMHTLKLLDIPATVETDGKYYRVVIGRYSSMRSAVSAAKSFENKGHHFKVVKE